MSRTPHLDKIFLASSAAQQPRDKAGLWVTGGGSTKGNRGSTSARRRVAPPDRRPGAPTHDDGRSGFGRNKGGSSGGDPAKAKFKAAEAGDIDASDLESVIFSKVPKTKIPDSDDAFEMGKVAKVFGTDTATFTDVTMRMFDHGYWGTSEHKGKEYLTVTP